MKGMDKKTSYTHEELQELKRKGLSYRQIGVLVGVSRQRVQQIVSPPRKVKVFVLQQANGRCARCGIEVGNSGQVHHKGIDTEDYNDVNNLEYLCTSCHVIIHWQPRKKQVVTCSKCGKQIGKGILCKTCTFKPVRLSCRQCGKVFQVNEKDAEYKLRTFKHTFCSRECKGRFVGINFGFKKHPENQAFRSRKCLTKEITLV